MIKKYIQYYIKTGLINCKLSCDFQIDAPSLVAAFLKVSGFKSDKSFVFLGESSVETDFEFNVEQNDNYPVFSQTSDTKFILSGNVNKPSYINNLPNIVYFISEKFRAEKYRAFTTHAAAARYPQNGKSVLILGDKGSGKTSMVMYLAQKLGFEITGNDSVILSSLEENVHVLSGTPYLTVRTQVLHDLFHIDKRDKTNLHSHEHKVTFAPEELNLVSNYEPSEVSLIVRIDLNIKNNFVKSPVSNKKTEALRLYQNISKYITGNVGPLSLDESGIEGYFPSLNNNLVSNALENLVNSLVHFPNFIYLSISELSQLDSVIKEYFK